MPRFVPFGGSLLTGLLMLGIALLSGGRAQAADTSDEQSARQILEETGTQGGLIVHLGCGDGKLTGALRAGDAYTVHGLDTAAANVDRARRHIQALGLYGPVSIDRLTGERLPYTDNLVNLLVAEAPLPVSMDEVMRVLCPSGTACIKRDGRWTKTVKPRSEALDQWTHFLHGPDNNAVACDRVVGPPHHVQWIGGPKWARSHDHLASVSALVSTSGRLFYIVDEGSIAAVAMPPKWSLIARDAFNGVVLWKRPVKPWEDYLRGFRSGPAELARRLVAVDDRVYVTLGYGRPVTALSAATGETLTTYKGTENTLEIVCHDGMLLLVVAEPTPPGSPQPGKPVKKMDDWLFWKQYTTNVPKKRLMAVDAATGKLVWEMTGPDTAELMPTTLAAQGDRVFFQNADHVVCLDAKSGKPQWRAARPSAPQRPTWSAPTLVVHGEVVYSADRSTTVQRKGEARPTDGVEWLVSSQGGIAPPGDLIAFSAEDGKRLWSCECRESYNSPVDVLVAGGLLWSGDLVTARDPGITVARDPLTGEVVKRRPPDAEFFQAGMSHHRCYRNKATDRYVVLGRAGVEMLDIATGRALPNHWVRGTCQYGVMPCNGLIYAPSHSCACFIESKLNGFNVLAPKRPANSTAPADAVANQLEKGPAYDQATNTSLQPPVSSLQPSPDWPTYRHDPARSGGTSSPLGRDLQEAWQTELGGKLSSVVVAEDKVFVAAVDRHTVHALAAVDGKPVWSRTVGGRVDSPPTVYRGLAVFGSSDGSVYCLRASDGELVWRFRAAPEDRRVMSYGQLESAWPVHGSVLVRDGSVYFAAGRSTYLDGGIYLYRLDLATGRQQATARLDTRDPDSGEQPKSAVRGFSLAGALPDVLSTDGRSIYMRHNRFDGEFEAQSADVPHLFSPAGYLDDSWWHRTYWMIGTRMASGWGSWPNAGQRVTAGRLLVRDGERVYGFGRTPYHRDGSHVGLTDAVYRLFAADLNAPAKKPAGKAAPPVNYLWSRQVPVLARAMVLADKTLLLAGPPDPFDTDDPAAVLEGRDGGRLLVVSASGGERIAEHRLAAPPVFDGMAVGNGRLYLTTLDGCVRCFAGQEDPRAQ